MIKNYCLNKRLLHVGDNRYRALIPGSPKQRTTHMKDGPLSGLKCTIKDNICTRYQRTTCASAMLENYEPAYDASVVRMIENAGAEIVGKTNMDEFGMGSLSKNSIFGSVINPLDPHLSAGGSSGGSAVSVATSICDFSLGTDTGGSVRMPASYCGIYGFKPSYGLISRYGVISYASSLDTVGILARDISIINRVFDALNKFDEFDSTALSESKRDILKQRQPGIEKSSLDNMKVGIPIEYFPTEIQDDFMNEMDNVIRRFEDAGASVHIISLPHLKYALPAYYILASAEASSNLSRFDDIRYGCHLNEDEDDPLVKTRTDSFGEEVKRRLILGSFVLSAESFESYFVQAQRIRRLIQQDFNSVFSQENVLNSIQNEIPFNAGQKVDMILAPVTTAPPPPMDIVKEETSPVDEYLNDALLIPSSLAGLPSLAIPFQPGKIGGFQLISQYGNDKIPLMAASHLP